MSMWNTEQLQLNELEWLFKSNVYVQVEYRTNPTNELEWLVRSNVCVQVEDRTNATHRMIIAG